jgi:hypothetical protein
MSTLLMKILLVEYVIIMGVCMVEGNWYRTLYWFGAGILQTSVILGMR